MRRVIAFFVRTPVWVNVAMISVLVFGLIALGQLRSSFFPEIEPDTIAVQVAYPGASPSEVAESVVLKIEEELDGLEGIERVTSSASEGFGSLSVEITRGAGLDDVLNDVKNAIDRINSFPADAEKPIIFGRKFRERALSVVLFGGTDLFNMKKIAENFRDELLATPEISRAEIRGLPDLEFAVEVSEADLQRYGLGFDEISAAVRAANVNISGGKFDTPDEEILIRAWGRAYRPEGLLNIPLRANADGTAVLLKDVATVRETWEDTPERIVYNGATALILDIDQSADEDILGIADITKLKVAAFNEANEQVELRILDDRTVPLRQRLRLLIKNGIFGLILVVMALGFFLNLRLSFWSAVSIPFAFAGMFIVAYFWGITVNVISLFGMIVVIGILVDDAIVVGENIYAHTERGAPPFKAAVDGTMEVIAPVTTSVLTTVIAFMPFFFLAGMLGKFIWQVALVVAASLLFSLVEAFFILPGHLAHSRALDHSREVSALRKRIDGWIHVLTHGIYAPSLRLAMRHKWITLTLPIAALLITIGLLKGGLIGVTFFPFIDGDSVPVNLSLTVGRQEADTERVLKRIETAAWEVAAELNAQREDGEEVIVGIVRQMGSNNLGESGSHAGNLNIMLLDGETRDMDSFRIANRIRERVGPLPEARRATFGRWGHFGKPVSISLRGTDPEQLTLASKLLVTELENFPKLKDVTDTQGEGRRELDIRLKPLAESLGLTLRDVAGQVRQGFFGQEIQRIQRGRDEIRVWVRYRPEDRSSLGFLERMRIRAGDGGSYPFGELAEYDIKRGISTINRLDRLQEIRVEASQTNAGDDLPPILAAIETEVMPRVLDAVGDVTFSMEGQSRSRGQETASMRKAFPMALLGMFILVVLVFRSYIQAGLIFSLIPIGILGAVWGHGIQGIQLNLMSIYGVIALSGIIINDSIVFVDQINRNLRLGQSVNDAVFNAGISRLRPILLTTITTALGLAPLMLETSRQAQFLIPMAASVAYGLLFGTFILLIILPAGFLAFNRLRLGWARGLRGDEKATRESVEPAVRELSVPAID
jgi:multidrug efflux pump subunit AcrB